MERKLRSRRQLPDPDSLPRPWLSSYPPGVPPEYDYPPVPLTRLLDDAARDFPETAAVSCDGAKLTYAQLLEHVDRLAAALRERDVRPGSRVAVLVGNVPSDLVALFAVLRLGAVAVLVGPDIGEDDLVRDLARCVAAVCLDRDVPRLEAVEAQLPGLLHLVAARHEDWLPLRRRVRSAFRVRRTPPGAAERMKAVIEASDPVARQASVDVEETAVVVSGTALSHRNLLAAAFQARLWVPDIQAGKERVAVGDAATTAHGLVVGLLAPVLSAATLVLVPDRSRLAAEIDRRRPTLLVCSPDACAELAGDLETSRRDATSVRAGLVGPAPVPTDVSARLEEQTEARIRECFGTAGAPFTHANPVYGRSFRGGIGLPVTDTVAVVLDPDDPARPAEDGAAGRLAVHGPQVAGAGWLVTDDRAVMDSSGYFRLVEERSGA